MKFQATVTISVERPITKQELKKYLEGALSVDLDTEAAGDAGVEGVSIDWDTLKRVWNSEGNDPC